VLLIFSYFLSPLFTLANQDELINPTASTTDLFSPTQLEGTVPEPQSQLTAQQIEQINRSLHEVSRLNALNARNSSRNVISQQYSYPIPQPFNEQRKFAGYEFDATTGLNYAGARYYDSSVAKFISMDSAYREFSS
jgi:RHS repeat-associated protein